jgi:hypothetical protein
VEMGDLATPPDEVPEVGARPAGSASTLSKGWLYGNS